MKWMLQWSLTNRYVCFPIRIERIWLICATLNIEWQHIQSNGNWKIGQSLLCWISWIEWLIIQNRINQYDDDDEDNWYWLMIVSKFIVNLKI